MRIVTHNFSCYMIFGLFWRFFKCSAPCRRILLGTSSAFFIASNWTKGFCSGCSTCTGPSRTMSTKRITLWFSKKFNSGPYSLSYVYNMTCKHKKHIETSVGSMPKWKIRFWCLISRPILDWNNKQENTWALHFLQSFENYVLKIDLESEKKTM